MRETVERLAQVLSNIDWVWIADSWEIEVAKLNLKELEMGGNRKTYADSHGELWDAYFSGGKLSFIEINYDVFEDVDSLSDSAYEDKIDEFFQRFEDDVKAAEKVLGKPSFCDGSAVKGFPDDQEANWLASWSARNARLMLQQKHESRELPFRLCFVVTPPANVLSG